MKDAKRVLVVASAGGHLQEALWAIEGLNISRAIATFRLPHLRTSGDSQLYFLTDPHTSLAKYLLNAWQSIWLLGRVRPDVIITTGAGIALASALFGKLVGTRLIFIESAACVQELSRTGAFLYRFADLFIVQWPSLRAKYPRAKWAGSVL